MWRHLVLYDGDCGLCDRSVAWLLRHDRRRALRYAPLQGETARPFVDEKTRLDTLRVVLRDGDATRVLDRSRAVFELLRVVGGPWRLVAALRLLPAWLTDLPYRLVARLRHRLFPNRACRLLAADEKALFLP